MIPKVICTKCGAELLPSDKFCSSCGLKITWSEEQPKAAAKETACKVCGSANPAGNAFCESCGAALAGTAPKKQKPAAKAPKASLSFLQSWKLTALIGVVLVAGILLFKSNRQAPDAVPPPTLSPQTPSLMSQIEPLERTVEAHPEDTLATLHLANLLYDARMFPRAAMMYARYLKMNPANPDARVDMGIAYFEMSFQDSTRAGQYLKTAMAEMEKALTYAPRHQLACFNLGILNFHTGDNKRALEWFKRCMDIDPNSETGKRAQQFFTQHQLTNQ